MGVWDLDGICSQPEYRRMGGVRALFDEIGKNAVENDITIGFTLYLASLQFIMAMKQVLQVVVTHLTEHFTLGVTKINHLLTGIKS